MALKALPNDVRSILCASAQINSYKTAVAELVYNSLDAESTSIAIRVHVQENRIQVVDNGCGIMKNDFEILGQRYMSSKVTDLSTLKSMPNFYGYRGEFLANIIELTNTVKIISRHKDGEETWAKTFFKGKKRQSKMTTRPSKGTTVEINGFLYNLSIKKQGIEPINDLKNIKRFLEQLSLVHNDISLSLRDDSRNEIIFKIHKKRDIYQTLSILFNIDKPDAQELRIEKNQYKVKALIGKTDTQLDRHWVYLNRKFIHNNSVIHKIIDQYLKKKLRVRDKREIKSKYNHEDDNLSKQSLPFYFVFITCPYMDYHVSATLRKDNVEFKDWEEIRKMLEKLVKFYVSDIGVKEKHNIKSMTTIKQVNDNTRNQVKKIIDKILGSNSKRISTSQLQNGVKGKLMKRKNKTIAKHLISKMDNQITNTFISNQDKFEDKLTQDSDSKCNKNFLVKNDHMDTNKKDTVIHTRKQIPSTIMSNCILETDFKTSRFKIKTKIKNQNKRNKMSSKNRGYKNMNNKNNSKPYTRNSKSKNYNNFLNVFHPIDEKNSVPEQTKIIAQKAQEFFRIQSYYPVSEEKCMNKCINKISHKVTNRISYDHLLPKIKKPFKTTYDLVQTILNSQKDSGFYQGINTLRHHFKRYPFMTHELSDISESTTKTQIKSNLPFMGIYSKHINWRESIKSMHDNVPKSPVCCKLAYENTYNDNKYTNINSGQYRYKEVSECDAPVKLTQSGLRYEDIFKENSDVSFSQNNPSCHLSDIPSASALTYESHKYNQNIFSYNRQTNTNIEWNKYVNKTHNVRFITKQSRDNFNTRQDKYMCYDKHYSTYKNKSSRTKHCSAHIKDTIDESYLIEITKSNEIISSTKQGEIPTLNQHNPINDQTYSIHDLSLPSYESTLGFGNTYTISANNILSDCNIKTQNQTKVTETNDLFIINSTHYSRMERQNCSTANSTPIFKSHQDQDNISTILQSTPQCYSNDNILEDDIQPINICETVFNENGSIEKEFAFSFNVNSCINDSLYNNVGKDIQKISREIINHNIDENVSHHFSNNLTANNFNKIDAIEDDSQHSAIITNMHNKPNICEYSTEDLRHKNDNAEKCMNIDHTLFNINDHNFDFKDRLRFLPKGMSQIFEKCNSKTVCDYNLDNHYYEDNIYNEFADDVHKQTEVYEPIIQNVQDFTTKDIHKFKNKVHKDNTSLVFDERSLKKAQTLNQIDSKFIAAIMKEKYRGSEEASKYLVLFDQHAVHERIKLERNLNDYFNEDKWKTVPLDDITLKMSKDEILYLHNYKDKFNQLGLQWTILNNDEVSVSCIPEAILGKNSREVDRVMEAVKNLIIEEINAIKSQKGCISMYPKSIMDLVCSEACRYAIKFGDILSKNDCIELLNDLSNCKTPFQCAHGRPVIAVLIEVKNEIREYKINMDSLSRFKRNKKLKA